MCGDREIACYGAEEIFCLWFSWGPLLKVLLRPYDMIVRAQATFIVHMNIQAALEVCFVKRLWTGDKKMMIIRGQMEKMIK